MDLNWTARQLTHQSGGLNLSVPRYNPRPAGVIRKGSATEAVLLVLKAYPGHFLTHSQLKLRTGRTQKALSWALIYLASQNLIERAGDPRNDRYRRYRAI